MTDNKDEERNFVQKRREENKAMSVLVDSGILAQEEIPVSAFSTFFLTRNLSPEMRILNAKKAGLISKDEETTSDKFPAILNTQQ